MSTLLHPAAKLHYVPIVSGQLIWAQKSTVLPALQHKINTFLVDTLVCQLLADQQE